jgi:hypothetical protein
MLGGTATQHRVDLKTLATGTFFGGWTHSSTGSKSNGSTGYFDTGFSPSANLSQNDNSVGYYNRSLSPVNGYHGVGTPNWFIIGKYTGNEYFPNASSSILQSTTDFHKMIIGTRRSSTDVELYRNGVSVQTGSVTSQALPSNNFWLGGINNGGSIFLPSDMDLAFFFLGDGLSDTEASNLTTAVNTYQTTLGRNV